MIDRWFPCEAVSDASYKSHGSGLTEKKLFTWFAARPIAQARAAVLTTLLPWPEEKSEQRRLQELVTRAVGGDKKALQAAAAEIRKTYPEGTRVLDIFSGRAIIPLEATRAGAESWGIDYSPVATLAGMLLADFPFRDWSTEPPLPFGNNDSNKDLPFSTVGNDGKFANDVRILLKEIDRRYEKSMSDFYPQNAQGKRPWGYLWAQTMPCDECKNSFPLVGSTLLKTPNLKTGDPGACFSFVTDRSSGDLQVIIHDGVNIGISTLLSLTGKRGKIARCPFCDHPHDSNMIKVKSNANLLRDRLLLVVDIVSKGELGFRLPTNEDTNAITLAERVLSEEKAFRFGVPAIPDEVIPDGNHDTVRASLYGVRIYGDMCCKRQTLGFVRLSRIIANLQTELRTAGCSEEYSRAMLGYAGAVVVRKLRRSTRGATLEPALKKIHDIFKNQASLNYGFDFFEAGIGDGAGTLRSLLSDTIEVVEKITGGIRPAPARIRQGSALRLPFKPKSITAVVTDPPYYNMIDYSDATDLFFVWLKRALGGVFPELFDIDGIQDKDEEIIVKRGGALGEHRTASFYTKSLKASFVKARSVLRDDGALTLVFGHGDPEAWRLLLSALTEARFIITGSWPARTEASAGAGSANIVVTTTIACRPAPVERPDGWQAAVDLEVEREIRSRIADWERDGLPLTDQLMAAYGPAMEVLGRYERVLRPDGSTVEFDHYISLARRTVQDAAAIKVDGLPLETFDVRTRFALFWVRLYGRQLAAKSEAVFQAMASDLRLDDVRRNILEESTKGYRFADFGDHGTDPSYGGVSPDTAVIDVVRQMVRGWRASGGEGVSTVMGLAQRDIDDLHLWATISYLAGALPSVDSDRKALDDIIRNRRAIASTRPIIERKTARSELLQMSLFQEDDQSRRSEHE